MLYTFLARTYALRSRTCILPSLIHLIQKSSLLHRADIVISENLCLGFDVEDLDSATSITDFDI